MILSVKLRLRRMGNTNRPFYRVVAIDGRKRRDGRAIEELGWYDAVKQPAQMSLKEEPILQWLEKGAEPSETVRELLRDGGILMKWDMLRHGATMEEATQKVATMLESRVEKVQKTRPSKKQRTKAAAAAEAKDEPVAEAASEEPAAEETAAE